MDQYAMLQQTSRACLSVWQTFYLECSRVVGGERSLQALLIRPIVLSFKGLSQLTIKSYFNFVRKKNGWTVSLHHTNTASFAVLSYIFCTLFIFHISKHVSESVFSNINQLQNRELSTFGAIIIIITHHIITDGGGSDDWGGFVTTDIAIVICIIRYH